MSLVCTLTLGTEYRDRWLLTLVVSLWSYIVTADHSRGTDFTFSPICGGGPEGRAMGNYGGFCRSRTASAGTAFSRILGKERPCKQAVTSLFPPFCTTFFVSIQRQVCLQRVH
ncbi:hypothetical protein EDD15DRAFT_2322394, partial [Pisolithus albus]